MLFLKNSTVFNDFTQQKQYNAQKQRTETERKYRKSNEQFADL
jgi:hypothetical protein